MPKAKSRVPKKIKKRSNAIKTDLGYIQRKSRDYVTPNDFAKAFTQEGTRDVSNYDDRFGRLFYNNDTLDKLEKDKNFRKELSYHNKGRKYAKIIDNNSKYITIYRAVPNNVSSEIQLGDWVTLDKQYAKNHLNRSLSNGKIISKKVEKKDIISESGDINEWIYSPQKIRREYKSLEAIWYKNAIFERKALAIQIEKRRKQQLDLERKERIKQSKESVIIFKQVENIYSKSQLENNKIKRLELLIEAQDKLKNSRIDPHKKNKLLRAIASDKVQLKRDLRREKGYRVKEFEDIEDRVYKRLDKE